MSEPYPPQYLAFFERFNNREYWEAHEVLEDLWREADHDTFYQGLIILAASYVHIYDKNNPPGARKCLLNVKRLLTEYAPERMGVDVDAVLAHVDRCLETLERLESGARLLDHIPLVRLEPGKLLEFVWA